jgi:eukaryotic-like serine/threonine-protein kinase
MSEPQSKQAGAIFMGREREFDRLKTALADVLSGQGRVVALAGEPGIGKTRLAREIMASAESQGAQVFWGNCYEWQGAPPYWPWIQIIRSYIQGSEPEGLKDKIGAGASDISEIVPELRDLMPGLSAPPSPESEQARFRLFDSIAGFLKRAGQEQPLALVLDDLQWADRPSLLLLEFLAQNLQEARLLLLGTYRDIGLTRSHPLSNTLGELTKHPPFLAGPFERRRPGSRPSVHSWFFKCYAF